METSDPVSTRAQHGKPEMKILTWLTGAAEEERVGAATGGFPD